MDDTRNVTLSLTAAGSPPGTLECTGGLTEAAVAGEATFAGCKIDIARTYTLTATVAGLTTNTAVPAPRPTP